MAEAAEKLTHTFAEYIALEEASDTKHELINGEIYATAHGTPEHGRLAMRMAWALRTALGKRPCEVFSSDVRVRVPATGLATYPDLSVVCGRMEIDPENRNTINNPIVIVEVLSESTESYDRGKKFRHYRSIPSPRDYLLVSQDDVWVEHYVRATDGNWVLHDTLPGGTIALASCGVELRVDRLYLKVFEAP